MDNAKVIGTPKHACPIVKHEHTTSNLLDPIIPGSWHISSSAVYSLHGLYGNQEICAGPAVQKPPLSSFCPKFACPIVKHKHMTSNLLDPIFPGSWHHINSSAVCSHHGLYSNQEICAGPAVQKPPLSSFCPKFACPIVKHEHMTSNLLDPIFPGSWHISSSVVCSLHGWVSSTPFGVPFCLPVLL